MNANTKKKVALAAAGVTSLVTVGILGTTLAQAAPEPSPTPSGTVDANTAATLQFMREEERLARDLYTAFDAQYGGTTAFSRIKLSEQRHFESVGYLLTQYGIVDSSAGKAAGTYADPGLQALYDKLLAEGKTSIKAAYNAGVQVEKEDIANLKAAIDQSANSTVDAVLANLLNASENHLAAFERAASGQVIGGGNGNGRAGAAGNGAWGNRERSQDGTQTPANGVGRGNGNRGAIQPNAEDCPVR